MVNSMVVYLRRCYRAKDGKRHAYWALVKSVRTAKGPRQEIMAYLGDLDEAGRLGVQQAAGESCDSSSTSKARMFEVPASIASRDGRRWTFQACGWMGPRDFGGPWLTLQLIKKLGFKILLDGLIPAGREDVPWSIMSLVLVICRLCDPSSELRIAEHLYERSAAVGLARRRMPTRSTTTVCIGRWTNCCRTRRSWKNTSSGGWESCST